LCLYRRFKIRLEPFSHPERILDALKTPRVQNLIVAEWETAADLSSNYEGLLERVMRIENMLSGSD
jgi:hypothetical protein